MKNWLIEYSCPDVLYLLSVVLTFFKKQVSVEQSQFNCNTRYFPHR